MDQLRALRYFVKLADTLNFGETADYFRVPSSSVSRRIKDLEGKLGAALFVRSTRSVQLTDLGRLYLSEVTGALRSIDLADEFVGTQSQNPTGILRITAMPGYAERFVLPALARLRQLYPQIELDLNITDQVVNLSGNDVDIAIRSAASLPDQVVARRLGSHEFVLVASPDYIAKNGAPKTVDALAERPVFMYRTPHGVLNWLTRRDGKWAAIDLKPTFATNHGQALLDSVLCGSGLALLPSWGVARDVEAGRLKILTLGDGPLATSRKASMGMYLLYHPPKFRLQKIRVTVDFLLEELRQDQTTL